MDYVPRRKSYGGSKPGRDVRKAPKALKLAVWRWAIKEIGGGNEASMYRRFGTNARFTPRLFEPVLDALEVMLPEEFEQYLGGRTPGSEANCVMHRFHKMYYGQTKTTKGRGEASKEHPRYWSAADRAAAEARLAEVGWPW